jgi:hypothetical protein
MTEVSDSRRQGQLSDTELSALRTQLVQLITQQGVIFTNWVKFAITVQGGLAAGLGAVLLSALAKYRVLGLIIAFFGIASSVLFAKILVRHTQWTTWYVRRCNKLADIPELFPQRDDIPEVRLSRLIWQVKKWKELGGPGIRSVVIFLSLVAIAWAVVLVWLLCLPLSEPSAQTSRQTSPPATVSVPPEQ